MFQSLPLSLLSFVRLCVMLLALISVSTSHARYAGYYEPRRDGSEALYHPLSQFLSYSFDTLQVEDSFSTDNFNDNLDAVLYQLRHPRKSIDSEGGLRRFFNRNVLPIDRDHANDSYALLPNYALHLMGGGMVYRKDLEWLRAHEQPYATASAITLAMVAEIIQEALEQETTPDDDAIADVYLFRPIGIWLFHNDRFARAFARLTDPAIWPSLQAYDLSNRRIVNAGINYVYRPPAVSWQSTRLFVYSGLNTLFGASHALDSDHALSWGAGYSVREVKPKQRRQATLDPSVGFFYDRNKSLLWSLVFNDAGGAPVRFNYFPDSRRWNGETGFFVSKHADDSWSAGLQYKVGFGIATNH